MFWSAGVNTIPCSKRTHICKDVVIFYTACGGCHSSTCCGGESSSKSIGEVKFTSFKNEI